MPTSVVTFLQADTLNKQRGFALLAGIILSLAYAPFNYPLLAIVSLSLYAHVLYNSTTRSSATRAGLLFGIGYFSIGISWVFVSMNTYGHMGWLVSGILTLLFIIIMSSFFALYAYLMAMLSKHNTTRRLWLFPAAWLLTELSYSHAFSGFPWLLIGNSQTNGALKALLPIIGSYGVGLIIALISVCIVGLLSSMQHRRSNTTHLINDISRSRLNVNQCVFLALLTSIMLTTMLCQHLNWTSPYHDSIDVALVQGSIPIEDKWNPKKWNAILHHYKQLTTQQNADLILWPETAVPVRADLAKPWFTLLESHLRSKHQSLLLGAPSYRNNHYYNSIIALGTMRGQYDKVHLVPFGEFFPLRKLLSPLLSYWHIPLSDFTAGSTEQPLFHLAQIHIAPFICYEIAYPFFVSSQSINSHLIITLTDDAWFGSSLVRAQHLQIAKARAIETGKPILFVNNQGPSAIIDYDGSVAKQTKTNNASILHGEIQPRKGLTPWVKLLLVIR